MKYRLVFITPKIRSMIEQTRLAIRANLIRTYKKVISADDDLSQKDKGRINKIVLNFLSQKKITFLSRLPTASRVRFKIRHYVDSKVGKKMIESGICTPVFNYVETSQSKQLELIVEAANEVLAAKPGLLHTDTFYVSVNHRVSDLETGERFLVFEIHQELKFTTLI